MKVPRTAVLYTPGRDEEKRGGAGKPHSPLKEVALSHPSSWPPPSHVWLNPGTEQLLGHPVRNRAQSLPQGASCILELLLELQLLSAPAQIPVMPLALHAVGTLPGAFHWGAQERGLLVCLILLKN